MGILFSENESNYNKQNIVDIISIATSTNQNLYNIMVSDFNYILVDGDIHKSQWSSDNRADNFWIKIKAFSGNHKPIPGLKAMHIYLCFRPIVYNYMIQNYSLGEVCINPPVYKGTNLPDLTNLNGVWDFVNISYGIPVKKYYDNAKDVPKIIERKKKRLEIIDPKTGKPIKTGIKQTGGAKRKKKRKLISLKNPFIAYFKIKK